MGHPSFRVLCARSVAAGGTVLTIATISRILTPDPRADYRSLPDWTYYETLLRLLGADPDDYQVRWERAQQEWKNRPRSSTGTPSADPVALQSTTNLPDGDPASPDAAGIPTPSAVGHFEVRGRRTRRQSLIALVFTAVVLLAGATAVTTWVATGTGSSPSSATVGKAGSENCQRDHRNLDAGRSAVRVLAAYRTGPAVGCPALGQVPAGTVVYFHCSVGTGNEIWTYGRVEGTHEQGWFRHRDLGPDQRLAPC
jgi:hypothetical protein